MMCRGLIYLLAGALALASSGSARAEIEIGFANPLSGPYALSGSRNLVGVQMAVRRLNDAGGVLGEPVALRVQRGATGNSINFFENAAGVKRFTRRACSVA